MKNEAKQLDTEVWHRRRADKLLAAAGRDTDHQKSVAATSKKLSAEAELCALFNCSVCS